MNMNDPENMNESPNDTSRPWSLPTLRTLCKAGLCVIAISGGCVFSAVMLPSNVLSGRELLTESKWTCDPEASMASASCPTALWGGVQHHFRCSPAGKCVTCNDNEDCNRLYTKEDPRTCQENTCVKASG